MATGLKQHAERHASAQGWLAGFWNALRGPVVRRLAYHRALRDLRGRSQRDLDDLGISRAMISRLAAEAAYGKKD